jgi:ABC-type transport system involved in multi-copper enzyme maturation permease subunit
MGLVASERDKGTLAWSLSKPLSRGALLLAKWSAATLVYAVAGLLLPMLACVAVASAAYGAPPDLAAVGRFTVAILTIPAFYIALCVALGTRLSSQAAVAGVALAVTFLPSFAGLISVDLARLMPPAMADWVLAMAGGAPVGLLTPVGWVAGMVAIAVAASVAFARAEL